MRLFKLSTLIFVQIAVQIFPVTAQAQVNSHNCSLIGHCSTISPFDVVVKDSYAYVTSGGLSIIDLSEPHNPMEVSYYKTGRTSLGISMRDNYAYVAEREGLSIIDVSDPLNPVVVGFFSIPYADFIDVTLRGNYAFVAAFECGLRIIDISDPNHMNEIGYFDTDGFATGIKVYGNYAYLADDYQGLNIFDISDLSRPTLMSYTDVGDEASNVTVRGNYAYVAAYDAGLRIVDISDPVNPFVTAHFDTPGRALDVAVNGNYAYVADENFGVRIIDVSDISNPKECGFYNLQGETTNIYIGSQYIFAADQNGLFILRNELDPNLSLFTQMTAGEIVNDAKTSFGASWGDYNNDGDVDLFVACWDKNLLYQNNGDGTFHKISEGAIATDEEESFGASWGDYNNDGNLDIFVANNGDYSTLYMNDGNGSFTKVSSGDIVQDEGASISGSWADYDNDGDLDIFIANDDGNNSLYCNDGDGTFTKILTGDIVNDGGHSELGIWGDYDNDGYADLFVANLGNENNFLYKNNGDGTFTRMTSGVIVNDGGNSSGGSWGDYDNDDDLDLFVSNEDQDNFLYQNNDYGTFQKISTGVIVHDGGASFGSSWCDYDNDGDLDLFVANRNNQNNFLYENKSNGTFDKITSDVIVSDGRASVGCSWCDYNNDGFLDLFVSNWNSMNPFTGQDDLLYKNNGNSNNWINIKCTGTRSNIAAIGAKIRVKATIDNKPIWQMQEISAQTGLFSQNSLNAEFGLGDAAIIDSIVIFWTGGSQQILTKQGVNQFLSITEPLIDDIGDQIHPAIAVAPDESYIVSWVDKQLNGCNIYAQRFSRTGDKQGAQFKVNYVKEQVSEFSIVDIDIAEDGSFIFVWDEPVEQNTFVKLYTQSGYAIGGEAPLFVSKGDQPAIKIFPGKSFVIACAKGKRGNPLGLYYYDQYGIRCDSLTIDGGQYENYYHPSIDVASDGMFVVLYYNARGDMYPGSSGDRISAGLFNADMNNIKMNLIKEIRVDDKQTGDFNQNLGSTPVVAISPDQSFVIVWGDTTERLAAKRYDSEGNEQSRFNISEPDCRSFTPAIAMNQDGDYVVTWKDYRNINADIYAQRYFNDDAPDGHNYRVNNDIGSAEQIEPDVAYPGNHIIHVWQENCVPAQGWDIHTKIESTEHQLIHVPADYLTIQEAIDAAADGDTIMVAPGSYDISASIRNDRVNNLQLIGSRKEDGSDASIVNAVVHPGDFAAILFENVSGCMICGFEIKNALTGIELHNCDNCMITHNFVHHNTSTTPGVGTGILVSEGHDVEITQCVIDSNVQHAIHLDNTSKISIINNTILRTIVYQGICMGGTEVTVKNNIIAWSYREGIEESVDSGFVHDYNCFFANGGVGHIGKWTVGGTVEQPIGPHSMDADPMIVDIDNHNYHLLPGSPCLGAGENGADIGAMGCQQTTCLLGDVNNDGAISPGDALCAFRIYLGGGTPPAECDNPCALSVADVNCTPNGITPGDALYIFQAYLNNLDPPLDCNSGTLLAKSTTDEKTMQLHIPNPVKKSDDDIIVPLQIDDASGISAFGLCLHYPADLLSFTGASSGDLTQSWEHLDAVETAPGILVIGGFHPIPILSEVQGNLIQLSFCIKPDVNGEGEFDITGLTDDLSGANAAPAEFSVNREGINMTGNAPLPKEYALRQNYPNPFNMETRIHFELPEEGHVTIRIFNLLGMEVETLVDGFRNAGYYSVPWNGRDQIATSAGSGVYICRIRANNFRKSVKMLLLK